VYPLATDIDLKDIRGAVGFGFLYKTPVGPVRLDFGFKLTRRQLSAPAPGSNEQPQFEDRMVFNVSLGQAF
jgi:outer membrane protein assembly factor BamA